MDGSDYINANGLDSSGLKKAYIVTQVSEVTRAVIPLAITFCCPEYHTVQPLKSARAPH